MKHTMVVMLWLGLFVLTGAVHAQSNSTEVQSNEASASAAFCTLHHVDSLSGQTGIYQVIYNAKGAWWWIYEPTPSHFGSFFDSGRSITVMVFRPRTNLLVASITCPTYYR